MVCIPFDFFIAKALLTIATGKIGEILTYNYIYQCWVIRKLDLRASKSRNFYP